MDGSRARRRPGLPFFLADDVLGVLRRLPSQQLSRARLFQDLVRLGGTVVERETTWSIRSVVTILLCAMTPSSSPSSFEPASVWPRARGLHAIRASSWRGRGSRWRCEAAQARCRRRSSCSGSLSARRGELVSFLWSAAKVKDIGFLLEIGELLLESFRQLNLGRCVCFPLQRSAPSTPKLDDGAGRARRAPRASEV